jgi:FkbM family methyltransferase
MASRVRLVNETAGLRLFETPEGPIWTPANVEREGLALILAEVQSGAYETDDIRVKAGDVVLDCGANVGVFARCALKAGAALVVCFEPYGLSAECLRRNLAADIERGRVKICPKGVWDEETELPFIIDPHNAGGNSFITYNKDSAAGPAVVLTTIDKAVRELGLPRVDFIKMDIEAAEARALAGAVRTIRTFRPRLSIAVEHGVDRIMNTEAVIKAVRQAIPDVCVKASLGYITNDFRLAPEVVHFANGA